MTYGRLVNTDPPPPPNLHIPPPHTHTLQKQKGVPPGGLRKVILTASGGAFRDWAVEDLKKVTVADALKVRRGCVVKWWLVV